MSREVLDVFPEVACLQPVRASRFHPVLIGLAVLLLPAFVSASPPLVPGTGEKVTNAGDDFEDPNWSYVYNNPKNSSELDGQSRLPNGYSSNRRWFEGPMRGHPDLVQRVATPEGGLPGSQGSLLMRSVFTGTPGSPSYRSQQDDFIANVRGAIGRGVPVSWLPSFVVRVYMPPFEEWEKRTGNTFALRAGAHGSRPDGKEPIEEYWPGMWIVFHSKRDRRYKEDSAYFLLRAGPSGRDFKGPDIKQTGWWTLGMSFTADGQVHYFAKPGIEDLTAADHLSSQYPYGFTATQFDTFFFDLISADDGHTSSTSWIIDDPAFYLVHRPKVATNPPPKRRNRR
jgi:hypothetical protein